MEVLLAVHSEGCDIATAAHRALKNRRLGFSALFRYCMATEGGDVEVAGLFEEAAFEQYLHNRWAYDRAWGPLIPAALKGARRPVPPGGIAVTAAEGAASDRRSPGRSWTSGTRPMVSKRGGSPSRSSAGAAAPTGHGGPDDGLEWLVDSGICASPAEAESLRDRALVPREDDAGRDRAGPGVARWRRWLEVGRPDPDEAAVRDAVLSWRLAALGDHPGYHLQRDLLHASLLRDLRPKAFRGQSLEPEPWVRDRVEHLEHRHQKAAILHTVLDVTNRRRIGRLWDELEGRLGPPDPGRLRLGADYGLLLALWACPPVGALLEWQGDPDHARDFGRGCRNGRVCPWCHARRVRALHDRLARGPCRPDRLDGKHLIRIRLRLASGLLEHHAGFAAFARARRYDVRRRASRPGAGRFLGRDEVRLVRDYWGAKLSAAGRGWGIEGGLIAHQVEPYDDRRGAFEEREHRHELTLVGSLPSARLGGVVHEAERLTIGFTNGRFAPVIVDVSDGDDPQALRRLLAGPPYQLSGHAGPLYRNWAQERILGDHSGALRLMPWFLAGPEQWWSHFEATRGSRLHSAFGTWKEAGGVRRRQAPLERHNAENRDEAKDRRERLLSVTRPLYADLTMEKGRKPGHAALRAALADELGREVSERDARWLVKAMKRP